MRFLLSCLTFLLCHQISISAWVPQTLITRAPSISQTMAFNDGVIRINHHRLRSNSIDPLTTCRNSPKAADVGGKSTTTTTTTVMSSSFEDASSSSATAAASSSRSARGKVNEIDFCVAPADVSLSRAYNSASTTSTVKNKQPTLPPPPPLATADASQSANLKTIQEPIMSLTLALNNASNRAVRRILLARSWPSAEALNMSLRQVAQAEKLASLTQNSFTAAKSKSSGNSPKCPVPRPILNVLTRKRDFNTAETALQQQQQQGQLQQPKPRGRSDEEYVADQIESFRQRYSNLPGYSYAEAYLESILSLATSGIESNRVTEVLEAGVYDESYKRVLAVLSTVGVVFETDATTGRRKIAKKLADQDICLSMLDKLQINREKTEGIKNNVKQSTSTAPIRTFKENMEEQVDMKEKKRRPFWARDDSSSDDTNKVFSNTESSGNDTIELTDEDLGGVLLSAEEPSMTRQLNVLSNIVQRALLFGGDQELLVLAETLDADRAAFVERWYPGTGGISGNEDLTEETRPGLQYLNCLVQLLRQCYVSGIVKDLSPPLPLSNSYANAYERLVATSVELGSGYLKPDASAVKTMPLPRNAREELGRFAVWESTFRKTSSDVAAYPEDLVGTWEIRDLIGEETIGTARVTFKEEGQVEVAPPLEGLRWRLDPGPTHLDTCTFQVLGSDGTILQYRGFIDRGARLEARFSKRALKLRGSVQYQMRNGALDYYKDILPVNYQQGATKFVMTKLFESQVQ